MRSASGSGRASRGEGGSENTTPVIPDDFGKRNRALARLKGRRYFAVRLNRLFMSDGESGIRRFKKLADRFTRPGIEVEAQVRSHPLPADNGAIAKWLRFVRKVVRTFGPNRGVTGLQITNEVNLDFSPNTSDGYWKGSVRAVVDGVIVAKRESRRHGYRWQKVGFNFAWRNGDYEKDAAFWSEVARLGVGGCDGPPISWASTSTPVHTRREFCCPHVQS